MICANCQRLVPSIITNSNYCIECGRPVTQICPYEEADTGTRLALRNDQGQAPALCPGCSNLLKVCRECGRLHRLDETVCRTQDCNTSLAESTTSFPSPQGALDGTRIVEWGGDFGLRMTPVSIQDVEELQFLTYRYGVLIALSRRNLLAYRWENGQWRRFALLSLSHTGTVNIHSIIIDEGRIYLIGEDRALVVTLGSFAIQQTIQGKFLLQAIGNGWWSRLMVSSETANVDLQVTNHETGEEHSWPLPLNASDISAMLVIDRILIATTGGELHAINPVNGLSDILPIPPHRWTQLATDGSRVIAIGCNKNDQLTVLGMTDQGNILGYHLIDNSFQASFAWMPAKGEVYLASHSQIATFYDDQLSQMPSIVGLPAAQTHEGVLALHNKAGQVRILLKRVTGKLHSLLLVDPDTGAQVAVGGAMQASPIVCSAEQYIIVAVREGAGMKLRTFAFVEGI